MRRITLLLIIFGKTILFGQTTLPQIVDTNTYHHELIFQSKGDIYSSSIQNIFINKLLFGGAISTNQISNSLSQQQNNNTLGIEGNVELEYRNHTIFPKKKWGVLVKTSMNTINSCHYTKDLFGLIFEGNENYLGKPLQLNTSSLQSISYFKFGIGFIHKKTKSNYSINLFKIVNYISSSIDFGAIYVNDISNLALLDFKGTSTSYLPSSTQTNYGIGIDLDLRIPITSFSNKQIQLNILAKNFGIGFLTNDVHYYSIDTNYIFQGLTLNQLGTLVGGKQNTDEQLKQLTIHSSNKIRFTPLLGFIQIEKMNTFQTHSRYQSIFGIRMYPSLSYIPYLYTGIQVRCFQTLWIGLHENYGITNSLRTGLYIKIIGKKIGVHIGTENLFDSFRQTGKGRSLQCRLQWYI